MASSGAFKWMPFLFLFLCMGCVSAADDVNTDDAFDSVSCGVTSSEQLLESKNITYNSSKLENCICKNDNTCNADILTIRECLKTEGLSTYPYTVNKSILRTGDIIHFNLNGTGHYEYYIENITDLNNFTGHIITTQELKRQKQTIIPLQKQIRGQLKKGALGYLLGEFIDWCSEDWDRCQRTITPRQNKPLNQCGDKLNCP